MAYVSPLDEIKKIAGKVANRASGFVTKTLPNAVQNFNRPLTARNIGTPQGNFQPYKNAISKTQRFIESPQPTKFPSIPYIQPKQQPDFGHRTIANVPRAIGNFGIDIASQVVGQGVIDPSLDIGRMIGNTITGKPNPQYNTLKSPATRLGYNIMGQNNKPQEVIGNIAGAVLPPLSVYGGGKVFGVGKNIAIEEGARTFVKALLKGGKTGAKYGGIFGGLQGLSDNRSGDQETQLKEATKSGLVGTGAGFVLGGGLAGAGHAYGRAVKLFVDKGVPVKEATKMANKYLRDSVGRFTKGEQKPFIDQMENGRKIEINPQEEAQFRKDLGLDDLDSKIGLQIRSVRGKGGIMEAEALKSTGKYQTIHAGGKIKMVDGEPVKIVDGVETFIHKDENRNWVVSEVTTGKSLSGGGYQNQHHAVSAAKSNINNVGEAKFKQMLDENRLATPSTPVDKFANVTPEQAKADFEKSWDKAYGNRPSKERIITELDKTNFTKHGKLPEGVTEQQMVQATKLPTQVEGGNKRMFEYTDTPMTSGEKAALRELEGQQINTNYTAAANELRQLTKESGQPELYKKVMSVVSDQKMTQAEATNYIKQGLDQMRSSGTNAKIKLGFDFNQSKGVKNELNVVEPNFTPINSKGLQNKFQGKIESPISSQELGGSRGGSSSNKSLTQIENPSQPYFNVNRLNVAPEVKKAVKQSVEDSKPQIEELVGRKVSNKEVVNFANTSAKVFRQGVEREQTVQWEAALLRTRQLLAAQAEKGTLTPEYLDNLLTVKSIGSDIARKLQSMSIGANPQEITAKQAIIEAILKQTKNADDILAKAQGVDFNDVNQATAFYRQYVKPTAEDWLTLVRYNSMLTSPNTHIVNTASNLQGTGIIAPIEKTVLGGVDFLRATVTGTERRYFAGEGKEYAKGFYSSLGEASHKFSDVMSGKSLSQNPDLRNIPLTKTGTKANVVEKTLSYPLKLLEGMDQFFSTLTQRGTERSLAYRVSKGVKVANPQSQAIKEAQKRLFRQDIGEKGQGTLLSGMDEITKLVFSARSSKNPIVRNIARFSLPFVKTPMNIIKQGVEYSPLGIANLPGNVAKQEALTKALMGTSIGVGTAMLLGSDRLTWAEPTNPDAKNAYRAGGLQPYSVRIGDNWVSYSKLHPAVAMNMALVAAVRDSVDNGKIEDGQAEKILQGLSNWWQFYADQSYVKSVGDMISASRGDVEGSGRIAANYVQQLVPFRALAGWVTRIIDPYQRKVNPDEAFVTKQLQQFMTQIPGLSQQVPARTTLEGTPIENQNRLLNAFSPNRVTTQSPQKRSEYQDTQEVQKLNKQADFDRKEVQAQALKMYQNMKTMSPEVANKIARETKEKNPSLFKALRTEVENDKYGLNYKERSIRSLPVEDGTRANYIARELKKLKTPEEKNALYKEWRQKKIISNTVLKQLKSMRKRGKL